MVDSDDFHFFSAPVFSLFYSCTSSIICLTQVILTITRGYKLDGLISEDGQKDWTRRDKEGIGSTPLLTFVIKKSYDMQNQLPP